MSSHADVSDDLFDIACVALTLVDFNLMVGPVHGDHDKGRSILGEGANRFVFRAVVFEFVLTVA